MNSKNDSREQMKQLGCLKLMQFCKDVKSVINCKYYDFLVSSPSSSSTIFAVKIFDTSISDEDYNGYISDISLNINSSQLMLPLIGLFIDFETGVAFARKIVNRRFDKSEIVDNGKAQINEWNKHNVDLLFSEMDSVICLLPQDLWAIQKTINVKSSDFAECHIVYFRRFTDMYKMKEKPQLTREERINRMFRGIPQNEYPSDDLDELILQSIKNAYPVSSCTSSTLISNTELRNLQFFTRSNMKIKEGTVIFMPNSSEMYDYLLAFPQRTLPQLPVYMSYFPNLKHNPTNIITQIYTVECPVEVLKNIEKIKDTYVPLSQYFLK